ncbi:MAG: hypothetical protein FWF15_06870, partial [Oscillospiraceae bacterium]|nr:hypothetical protein [Oscillospiraceae bacterium]
MKKLTLILLIILLLFSCAEKIIDEPLKPQSSDENETTIEEFYPLPKDLNFNGAEIRFYQIEDPNGYMFINPDEITGDIVYDAVYTSNSKVQETLNVTFTYIEEPYEQYDRKLKSSMFAAEDSFDVVMCQQWVVTPSVLNNMFINLKDAPYIDLNKPWWATDYIKEMTIGNDRLYFVSGDISLNVIRQMSCVYYNKQVYENNGFGEPDDMYTMVLDGKWTMDKLDEMVRVMYIDLNGDGQFDDGDQYGTGVITYNLTDHFTYDAGVRASKRNSNGIPELIMNNEHTINFTEKLYKLFYENPGVRIFPPHADSNNIVIPNKFMNNELLFDFGWFHTSEFLRDMNADYGIIPYPKYDEVQPTYLSLVHDSAFVYCIPVTCNKFEAVCAIFEAMAYEGYKTNYPAYYEIALKAKYMRDANEVTFKIIDMIYENATTDFIYVYNYALDNMGLIMRELMTGKSDNFVSAYTKKESGVEKKL